MTRHVKKLLKYKIQTRVFCIVGWSEAYMLNNIGKRISR